MLYLSDYKYCMKNELIGILVDILADKYIQNLSISQFWTQLRHTKKNKITYQNQFLFFFFFFLSMGWIRCCIFINCMRYHSFQTRKWICLRVISSQNLIFSLFLHYIKNARIRVFAEPPLLVLYGKIWVCENPYFRIF